MIPSHLKTAYEACQKMASVHYENFPVASLLLPEESRPHIAALYAFARTADDFADEDRYEGRRIQEINRWEKGLRAALKGQKAPVILQAFAHTLKTFRIPLSLPLDLLKAYRMDLTKKRYKTWNEVLYYCRHSANPVGRMVLYISNIRDKKRHRYSDAICTGLQLINFWQDTAIDLGRNRIYYPQAELKKAGVREKDLLSLQNSPAARLLVRNAVNYTERSFQKGYPLLNQVSGRLRLELRATYLGGQGILSKIRKMDYNVLQNRPVWTHLDKVSLAVNALLGRVKA
ncbi:MAG TPA: squalene synthase HpnC [bacterium]|jgi:squalene synthase HpnC|nr:squalene synthase HpnC [bacterium]